jgi:hypothetical protein
MQINRSIRLVLFSFLILALPAASFAQIALGVSITIAPPALPVYTQPPCPTPGYMWTPGYWAWGPTGYFWVPGTWVMAPAVGVLWTPGYWGWGGGVFLWHAGYWGPHIGFYGGVNYGYGYGGVGFVGGRWEGGAFSYNRSVTNITNVTNVTNVHVYNQTVVNNTTVNNVSYNGGTGGIAATPTPAEEAAAREPHTPPTAEQTQHEHTASANPALRESVNHGKPAIAATSKPGQFTGPGVVAAKAAGPAYKPAAQRSAAPAGKTLVAAKGTTVPRPNTAEHNTPRPPSSHSIPPARTAARNVPHPPSASTVKPASPEKPGAPHPQTLRASNNSAPHPGAASKSAPHPSSTAHASTAHVKSSAHAQAAARPEKPPEEHGK